MTLTRTQVFWAALIVLYLLGFGFIAALSEGIVPHDTRQVLLVLFVVGPLLIFGEGIAELLICALGWLAITVVTFGKVRVDWPGEPQTSSWHGFNVQPDGRYTASHKALALAGLSVLVLVGASVAGVLWLAR